MNATELQTWLNEHGQSLVVDGDPGAKTREAIIAVFTNKAAAQMMDLDIEAMAARLGCTVKQLRAVSIVESAGGGFDKQGRPKILFERHLFHRLTKGKFTPASFSQIKGGGYKEDSWIKLTNAACKDAAAAFSAVSWGKFQVLGSHWKALGYPSPIDMAYTAVRGEPAHYEMLARFIEHNSLKPAIAKISTTPADNVAFASRYNGPAFKKFAYDEKLAKAMR